MCYVQGQQWNVSFSAKKEGALVPHGKDWGCRNCTCHYSGY